MKKIFRNAIAQRYFEHFKKNRDVYECGIDNHGLIYIAWLNGNVDRYLRHDFIIQAEKYYSIE